jgi:NADPH:quinone reductase-like Zn-dependent oxidoreductase
MASRDGAIDDRCAAVPKIKKVVITEFGDESKLALMEADLPPPRKGEVQIAVQYTVVSGSDINMRRGTYPFQRKPPLTPGYSIVGTVRLNGPGSARFAVGDRVACLTKYDGQAELVNQPERYLVRVPDGADPKLAVVLVLDWLTAYQMLHYAAHVKPGQRLFVHGLSGGVGRALLALGQFEGADVFGTASTAKHPALRELGAIPFDYVDKQWIAAMRELGGVDAVFDPLGYESFDESYSILRRGGILVGYGMNLPGLSKADRRPALPVILKLFARNLLFWTGRRTTFFGLSRRSKHYTADLQLLFDWLKGHKLAIPIKGTFNLANIQAAHRVYEQSGGMGSIIIEV